MVILSMRSVDDRTKTNVYQFVTKTDLHMLLSRRPGHEPTISMPGALPTTLVNLTVIPVDDIAEIIELLDGVIQGDRYKNDLRATLLETPEETSLMFTLGVKCDTTRN